MAASHSGTPKVNLPKCPFKCKTCKHTTSWVDEVNLRYQSALLNDTTPLKKRLAEYLTSNCQNVIVKHFCEATEEEAAKLRAAYKQGNKAHNAMINWLDANVGASVLNSSVIFLAFDMEAVEAAKRVVHEMFHIARIRTDASVKKYIDGVVNDPLIEEREEMLGFLAQELLFSLDSDNETALNTMWATAIPLLKRQYKMKITLTPDRVLKLMRDILP